jgi:hypothetical protein
VPFAEKLLFQHKNEFLGTSMFTPEHRILTFVQLLPGFLRRVTRALIEKIERWRTSFLSKFVVESV